MPLSVSIKKKLGDFSLDVEFEDEGKILGLLGASGCGKSMTLKCIAGIETPDTGRIVLDGRVLFDSEKKINLPPQKRRTGYLFQSYALFPHMTVYQNIAAGIADKSQRADVVKDMIKTFCLEGKEGKLPTQISGGERQRVALARVLANRPEILMLDEPFSALDSYLRWKMEQELSETLTNYKKTTLFVSHSRDEVYRLCDVVCVIDNGKSEPVVPVKALFENPRTFSAAMLSGCKNYSRAEAVGPDTVNALDWGVTLRCGRDIPPGIRFIGVRAHYVIPTDADGENVFTCEVMKIIDDVFSTIVIVRPINGEAGSEYGMIRIEMQKKLGPAPGETVRVLAEPSNILLLE